MISDLGSLLDLEFDFLKGHCTFIKKFMQNEQKILTEKLQKASEKIEGRQKNRFNEYFINEQYYVNDLFPSIQWAAMFVVAFNLFEKTLNDICSICKAKLNLGIELRDIEGRGIERAKKYLSKVHGITDSFSKNGWQEIKTFSRIRNVLSHTYGELDLAQKNHKNIFDEITKKELGIRVVKHDQVLGSTDIIVDENSVFSSIEIYRKFIELLISEIENKI